MYMYLSLPHHSCCNFCNILKVFTYYILIYSITINSQLYFFIQVICQSSRISTCAVFTHSISSSNTSVTCLPQTQLIAVVVPIVSDEFVLKHLTQEISTILPSSSMPDHFVIVDSLPINSHGNYYSFIIMGNYNCFVLIRQELVS